MKTDFADVPEPRARIFLLSHMRAYTSLAGHILGSHPQIDGYYEMHLGYEDASAPVRQREAFLQSHAFKPGSRYLFDKLLHNDYRLLPERLGLADIKILVSLAGPEHSIRSIVHLFAQKGIDDPYASPVGAANYYIARVNALAGFCRACAWPYCYFDAELWQCAPEKLLPELTAWLELELPLSERYQVFSHTGKAGKGDSSPRILSGRIDKTRADYSHIAVPAESLREAQEAYQECRRQIIAGAKEVLALNGLGD
ncbi:MAG: hypothetical protein AB1591_06690 [Pseudomonadota bacterium]